MTLWPRAVRAPERGRFVFFVALGGLFTLAQTLGLAGAEALFLARAGVARLPETYVLASIATVAASLGYALRVGRARNDRVMLELLVLAGLAVVGAGVALQRGATAALPAFLCLYFATQAVLTSHYWTLAGDFFDVLAAKRLVPLFTVGNSVGGALGGGLALALVERAGAVVLVTAWAVGLAGAAALVLASRGRLARWRALAQGEEDETSVAGIASALRHLRHSSLGRWLVVSALAMVLALFVAQYLYADVLVRAFPDERRLATFLALYLAASNLVEIAVEVALTPLLIRRLGVPTANLVHPLLTIASFAALFVDPRLPVAIAARANRELLENALAGPVRNLAYNALPARLRARVRAFLEGIVIYAGMSVAGGVLLATRGLRVEALAAAGVALGALYALANARVRREYVRALETELRAGRLDLRELRSELGPSELAELAALWEHLVRADPGEPDEALLELASLLVERGFDAPVRAALSHPSARLRAACLEALGAGRDAVDASLWLGALADPEPRARLVAARALPEAVQALEAVRAALRVCLADADPSVRAEAARRLGSEGEAALGAMLASTDAVVARAALNALPPATAARGATHVGHPDPGVRGAALAALARAEPPAPIAREVLVAALGDREASVRRAAVQALAVHPDEAACAALGRGLVDPAREVRSASVDALAAAGALGLQTARAQLDAASESGIGAALRVLGAADDPRAPGWLRRRYADAVREAWEALLLARALASAGAEASLARRFLPVACSDAFARAVRVAFRALARLEDERVVRSVQRALRFARGRSRADALEVLTHLGDREASQVLALLLEPIPLEEKLGALRHFGAPPAGEAEALARACALTAPWVRAAAARASESGTAGAAAATAEEGTMQRLLALRQVSLFSGLSLERLQALERIATDAVYEKGEVIVREGDAGDELFLLVEGRVDFLKDAGGPGELRLGSMEAGGYFGEMAVLDGHPRSVTVVAASSAQVLVLAGSRLREIVHEMPDLALDLFRVLAARLRRAEQRAAGIGAAAD